ncbi:hypothetical protein RB195_007876 [Necator americanus]|uniref:Uncharacterized protein n=1 Tax=Necator americanus TaxID=51031 RepID=A0ABR1BZC4_NECAM
MGSKTSKEDKAMSPLSSWGGSFDDLICGDGKICGDRWTPIPSRESSPIMENFQRSRSAASFKRMTTDYDDDFEVIRQQPLPMDPYDLRTPMEIMDLDRPLTTNRRDYMPHSYTTPDLQPVPSKRRKKRKKPKTEANCKETFPSSQILLTIAVLLRMKALEEIRTDYSSVKTTRAFPVTPIQIFIENRKAVEIDPRNPSRTIIRLDGTSARKPVQTLNNVSSYRHRSISEPQNRRRMAPISYKGHWKRKSLHRNPVVLTRTTSMFARSTTNSENTNTTSLRSTRRVVPPRYLRPFAIPPPQPFRIRALPDQPYHRIRTATHPHL